MRITFDSKGEIKVEGEAELRLEKNSFSDKVEEGQTWHITTKLGNTLVLAAVGEYPDPDYHGGWRTIHLQDKLSDDDRKRLLRCPIAQGMFYYQYKSDKFTNYENVCVYDFVQEKFIHADNNVIALYITFRSIYLRLLNKLDAYDRECENSKNLKRIAEASQRSAASLESGELGLVHVVPSK